MFTDDDLKRLKEKVDDDDMLYGCSAKALLSRLEAAEKALEDAESIIIKGATGQWTCDNAAVRFFKWRKACGK